MNWRLYTMKSLYPASCKKATRADPVALFAGREFNSLQPKHTHEGVVQQQVVVAAHQTCIGCCVH